MLKRISAVLLCIALALVSLNMQVFAVTYPVRAFVKSSTGANIYSKPGETGHEVEHDNSSQFIVNLPDGTEVVALGEALDGDNDMWYQIRYDGDKIGFAYSGRIRLSPVYNEEVDFEVYLTNQNFPESYKVKLRQLHALYPSWVFVADHLSLTWDEVVNTESKVGNSLIEKTVPDSWKSMEYGAYNYNTNSWVEFEPGWVAAAKETVEYFIDPRNNLDEHAVFQFLSQSYDSTLQTLEGVKEMVKGTFLDAEFPEDTYETYSDVIIAAANESGVNPYVLASMILTEQGVQGTGGSISGTVEGYEGLYNYYAIGATTGEDPVKNGLNWANGGSSQSTTYMRPWNTRAKSIIGGAVWYAEKYVSTGQSTLYYKRFDVSSAPYYQRYMTNIRGANTEGKRLRTAYEDSLELPLTFKIPVYKDMPSDAMPSPSTVGNNDSYLSALSVGDYALLPDFSMHTTEYEVNVDNSVTSVTVTATPRNSAATVEGAGEKQLQVGVNTFNITVTSTSGITKTYVLHISRAEPPAVVETPKIETATYSVGTYITGVEPETGVQAFLANFHITNGYLKMFDKDGNAKTDGLMTTGTKVEIYAMDDTIAYSYETVIFGDTSGDGKIGIVDTANIQKHMLDISELKGCFIKAADTDHSGGVNIVDVARIQKHFLDILKITQQEG